MAAAACCGDDNAEYRRTETGGTDAPAGYGNGITTCCNVNTDCTYNDACYATTTTSAPARPNKAYCNGGTWQGGDAGSAQCNAIMGSVGYWNLGGEVAGSACCGDDSSEYVRTETASGADAPSGYDDGVTTCCNSNTDCTYNDVCVSTGTTSSPVIPNKAYCNGGSWQGGDDSSTACSEITGASNLWNLGGDTDPAACCGDDGTENVVNCAPAGPGACAESTDDTACCADPNACVYEDGCYADTELTLNSAWICQAGAWIPAGVDVTVDAIPPSVTTTWQNTDATAQVNCVSPSPVNPCDPDSYRLQTFGSGPVSCSDDYADYTLNNPQTISSHVWVCGAAKNDVNTEGFSEFPVEFRVDQLLPTASITPFPATWTDQTSVIVNWNGADTGGSGLDFFELQVRIRWTNGTMTQDWTDWTTSISPGSLPYSGMENNKTYYFRARANDNAGNAGLWSVMQDISVDTQPPVCSVEDLPIYTNSLIFYINWSGSDGESGLQHYDVQARAGAAGCGIPTSWGILDGLDDTILTSHTRGYQECQYFFRCRATDNIGNEGGWSAETNTTVDSSPPITAVDPLPQWWNLTQFDVSWSGSDSGTGIDCYDIQWSNNATDWDDWLTCTTLTTEMFGPLLPVNLSDNTTYYFRSRATDLSGLQESYPSTPDAETSIDFFPPEYALNAYDQDGVSLLGREIGGVTDITLSSIAVDQTSGVENNTIEWLITLEGGESSGSYDCGSASPYGGVSSCDYTVDFSGGIMIEFWVSAMDRAGNGNVSSSANLGIHPLANFGKHSIYVSMGESATVGVYVRNIRNQPDNITVMLSSTLPVNPYFVILEDMTWVVDRWIGNNIELMDDNMTLILYNLNPGASPPPIPVMVWSSDTPSTYQMSIDAFSSLAINDTDQAMVQINYPVSFPGLTWWAIILLMIFAAFIYMKSEKIF